MREQRRVVCTGMGAVSCFGLGVAALWDGLKAGRSGQAPVRAFDASPYRSPLAAEISNTLRDDTRLFEATGRPDEAATYLATIAAHEAFRDAGLAGHDKSGFGCIVGTLCAGSRNFERYARRFAVAGADPAGFPRAETCAVDYQLEHLVRHFGFEGPSSLVSTACSSSTDAIGYGCDLIRRGHADLMLVGGGDILCELVHAGFNSVFSITRDRARPFDTRRDGFFIGEGAGMLVLETLGHALARGAHIHAELMGYGLSNAACHLTATSPDGRGEALAIERCLDDAGVDRADVDYVNAHGTATRQNDLSEALALRHVFGDRLDAVAVTSIKANIGHCMGASGALEAIATIRCIRDGRIPGTVDSTGDLAADLDLVTGDGRPRQIRHALSESFGFAGASSALLLGAFDAAAPATPVAEAVQAAAAAPTADRHAGPVEAARDRGAAHRPPSSVRSDP